METKSLKFDKKRRRAKYCPCGKSNRDGKFVPYVDYEKKGYCHSCGETFLPELDNADYENHKIEYVPPPPPSYHPAELVKKSGRDFRNNNFVQYLKTLFSEDEVKTAIRKYLIGTSKKWNGATVFWQIDNTQRVRHGKIMLYSPKTGKRSKNAEGRAYINSVRSTLKLNNFNLKQCLFGLHLINETETRTVAIVEGEKTAVIMSLFKPEYIWLATGSKQGFKHEMLKPLKRFKIIAFPDKSEYTDWQDKALELKDFGFDISVSEYLESTAYENGTDLADVFVDEVNNKTNTAQNTRTVTTKAEATALKLAKINPALRKLITEFELTDTNGVLINIEAS